MSDDIEKAIDGADYQAKWNLCAQALANAYEDEAGIIVLAGEGVVAFVPVGKLMGQQEPRHDMRYLSQDSGVAFAIKTDGLYHIRLFELRDSSLGLSFSELATGAGPEPAFMRLDKFTRDEITKAEYEAAMATA